MIEMDIYLIYPYRGSGLCTAHKSDSTIDNKDMMDKRYKR